MNTKFLKLFTLAVAFIIGLNACSKKDNPNPTEEKENNGSFYFNAKIDGTDFSADMKSCECTTPASFLTEAYKHNGNLYIKAKKNTTNASEGEFWVSIGSVSSPYTGAGAYALVPQQGVYAGVSYTLNSTKWGVGDEMIGFANGQGIYSTTTGTITITKDESSIVEGTFSFNATTNPVSTTKVVTEGKFRMKYRSL